MTDLRTLLAGSTLFGPTAGGNTAAIALDGTVTFAGDDPAGVAVDVFLVIDDKAYRVLQVGPPVRVAKQAAAVPPAHYSIVATVERDPLIRLPVRGCGIFSAVDLGTLRRVADTDALSLEDDQWVLEGSDPERIAFRIPDPDTDNPEAPESVRVAAWERVWAHLPTIALGSARFVALDGEMLGPGQFRAQVALGPQAWPAVGVDSAVTAENRPYTEVEYSRPRRSEEEALAAAVDIAVGVPLFFGQPPVEDLTSEPLWAAYALAGAIEVEGFDGAVPAGQRFTVLFAGAEWEGNIARCLGDALGDRAVVRVRSQTQDPKIAVYQARIEASGLRSMALDVEVYR